ncbi:MAG: hypothetical protein WC457_01725 [Patescibacteria group bacterium]
MKFNLTKTLYTSGKYWILAIAVVLASAIVFSTPAEAEIADISQKTCAFTDFDRYTALYYRQTKEKEVKSSETIVSITDEASRAKKQASLIEEAKTEELSNANETLLMNSKKIADAVETSEEKPDKVVNVVMTAYTSTPDQTDDTPDIAASGKHVYDGMLAANWLPMGTKVKIPELYGDKIFTIDDRMNKRYGYGRMDIWLDTTKAEARKFGVKRLTVEIYYAHAEPKELAVAK